MKLAGIASMMSGQKSSEVEESLSDVVEIGILLPANRAADLIRVAHARRESVGQMIRRLIDRELAATRIAN